MSIPANFFGNNYKDYFLTNHWQKLKEELLYSNPKAKCWICSKKNTLLIHHVDYSSLFHEVLNRDVYIVCFNCHTRIHFPYFGKPTPLKKDILKRRMYFLKYTKFVRDFRLGSLINRIWLAVS